ncbi:hypothetical protein D3C86_2080050 [compost metagenome]
MSLRIIRPAGNCKITFPSTALAALKAFKSAIESSKLSFDFTPKSTALIIFPLTSRIWLSPK